MPFFVYLWNHKLEQEKKQGNGHSVPLGIYCVCAKRKDLRSQLVFSLTEEQRLFLLFKASLCSKAGSVGNVNSHTTHKCWWHLNAAIFCVEDTARDEQKHFPFLLGTWTASGTRVCCARWPRLQDSLINCLHCDMQVSGRLKCGLVDHVWGRSCAETEGVSKLSQPLLLHPSSCSLS